MVELESTARRTLPRCSELTNLTCSTSTQLRFEHHVASKEIGRHSHSKKRRFFHGLRKTWLLWWVQAITISSLFSSTALRSSIITWVCYVRWSSIIAACGDAQKPWRPTRYIRSLHKCSSALCGICPDSWGKLQSIDMPVDWKRA